jgi:hypothetical protein
MMKKEMCERWPTRGTNYKHDRDVEAALTVS